MKKITILFLTAILFVLFSCSNGTDNDFVKYAVFNKKSENSEMVKVNLVLEGQKSRMAMPDIDSLLSSGLNEYYVRITAINESGQTVTLLEKSVTETSSSGGDYWNGKFSNLFVSSAYSKYFGNVSVLVNGYKVSIVEDETIKKLLLTGETSANLNTGKSIVVPMMVLLNSDEPVTGTIDIDVGFDDSYGWTDAGWNSSIDETAEITATLTHLSANDGGAQVKYELTMQASDTQKGAGGSDKGIWIDGAKLNLYVENAVPGYYFAEIKWKNCQLKIDGKIETFAEQPVYFDDNIIVVGAAVETKGFFEPFYAIKERKFWATEKSMAESNSGLFPGELANIYLLMEKIISDYNKESKVYNFPKYRIVCTDFDYLDADSYDQLMERCTEFGKNLNLELSFERYSINFGTDESGSKFYADGAIAISGNTADVNFKPKSTDDGEIISLYLGHGGKVNFRSDENVTNGIVCLYVDDDSSLDDYAWLANISENDNNNAFFTADADTVILKEGANIIYVYDSATYPSATYKPKSSAVTIEKLENGKKRVFVSMYRTDLTFNTLPVKLVAKHGESNVASGDEINIFNGQPLIISCDCDDTFDSTYTWYINDKKLIDVDGDAIADKQISIDSLNKELNYGKQNVVQCLCTANDGSIQKSAVFIFSVPGLEVTEPESYAFVVNVYDKADDKGMIYGLTSGSEAALPYSRYVKTITLLAENKIIVDYADVPDDPDIPDFELYTIDSFGIPRKQFIAEEIKNGIKNYKLGSKFVYDPVTEYIWVVGEDEMDEIHYLIKFKETDTQVESILLEDDLGNFVIYNNNILTSSQEIPTIFYMYEINGITIIPKEIKDLDGVIVDYEDEDAFVFIDDENKSSETITDVQMVKQNGQYYAYYLVNYGFTNGSTNGSIGRMKANLDGFQMDKDFINRNIGYSFSIQKYNLNTIYHGAANEAERKSCFLGPQNFVAIKEDYLAIYDLGYHVMDGNELKLLGRGRIMQVNLNDYTVSVAKDGLSTVIPASGTWGYAEF